MPASVRNSSETNRLLRGAAAGDATAWAAVLERHRARLVRMVALRLDDRLQGRLDLTAVLTQVYEEASRRRGEGLASQPFFLWLRALTGQALRELHRRQLGEARQAREVLLEESPLPEVSSAALALQLLGQNRQPHAGACHTDRAVRLREAFNRMGPLEREVLALRHFEQLSNAEAAEILLGRTDHDSPRRS
jgi:RNA polymerase sigma-70 factor (ECF subfamily)